MNNSILNGLKEQTNIGYTENGAIKRNSTLNEVYDMFAFGGAYRGRDDKDCIFLFKKAFEQDESLAMKCLFYIRDIRGGQGERKFFRICFHWLCDAHPAAAKRNLEYISEFGRWDDLLYATEGTKLEEDALYIIKKQLVLDLDCKTPSLLGKWLPSENASSYTTIKLANKVRKYLNMTHKEYRKVLASLRTKINIVEKLMSENRWDEIEFDKIPSKAGLIYKNAFARRDLIAQKYTSFIKDENTKVNTKALYPYDVVAKARDYEVMRAPLNDVDRLAVNKYWAQLPNYLQDDNTSMLCVVDTSGSMTCGNGSIKPIDVAISLGIYAGERAKGAFKNHYISFASRPQLISTEGVDFVDEVKRIYETNLVDNTDLVKVFDLLRDMVVTGKANSQDLPDRIIVISDMEIDYAVDDYNWTKDNAKTTMEKVREEWNNLGLKMPRLVYWNVDARNNTVLDLGPDVSLVSGASAQTFEMLMQDVTGWQLCLNKLMSTRYECIK